MSDLIEFYISELREGSSVLFELAGVAISKERLEESDWEGKEDTNESEKRLANVQINKPMEIDNVIELD